MRNSERLSAESIPSLTEQTEDSPGGISFDDLENFEFIADGGSAEVYRADVRSPNVVEEVAVKQPRAQGTVSTDVVEEFLNEADRWSRIDDFPYIASVYGSGTGKTAWIAIEYLPAGTLSDRVGSLDESEALWIATAVADSMQHAHHRGVVHLDLKPTNVLFDPTEEGTWDVPKVVDWGLAKSVIEDPTEPDGLSPEYAAPEQFDPEQFGTPSPATDIYQMGVLLYEMLTGVRPFEGPNPELRRLKSEADYIPVSELDPEVPSDTDTVVERALAPVQRKRFPTAAHFMDACIDLFEELPSPDESAEPAPQGEPLSESTQSEQEGRSSIGETESSRNESSVSTSAAQQRDDGPTRSEATLKSQSDENQANPKLTQYIQTDSTDRRRQSLAEAIRRTTENSQERSKQDLSDVIEDESTVMSAQTLAAAIRDMQRS